MSWLLRFAFFMFTVFIGIALVYKIILDGFTPDKVAGLMLFVFILALTACLES